MKYFLSFFMLISFSLKAASTELPLDIEQFFKKHTYTIKKELDRGTSQEEVFKILKLLYALKKGNMHVRQLSNRTEN